MLKFITNNARLLRTIIDNARYFAKKGVEKCADTAKSAAKIEKPKSVKSVKPKRKGGSPKCPAKPEEPKGKAIMFRNISLGLIAGVAGAAAYLFTHMEPHERQPFVKYEYLRLRNKPYFFYDGNRTLFHNPHINPLPDGYEDELEDAEEPKAEIVVTEPPPPPAPAPAPTPPPPPPAPAPAQEKAEA